MHRIINLIGVLLSTPLFVARNLIIFNSTKSEYQGRALSVLGLFQMLAPILLPFVNMLLADVFNYEWKKLFYLCIFNDVIMFIFLIASIVVFARSL